MILATQQSRRPKQDFITCFCSLRSTDAEKQTYRKSRSRASLLPDFKLLAFFFFFFFFSFFFYILTGFIVMIIGLHKESWILCRLGIGDRRWYSSILLVLPGLNRFGKRAHSCESVLHFLSRAQIHCLDSRALPSARTIPIGSRARVLSTPSLFGLDLGGAKAFTCVYSCDPCFQSAHTIGGLLTARERGGVEL
jgi:hypothetical protein